MCNLNSITTNQAAIAVLFRVINRYVGNLAPMPGVFPDYPAPVIRNTDAGTEMVTMRWGMPSPPRTGGPPVTNIRNTSGGGPEISRGDGHSGGVNFRMFSSSQPAAHPRQPYSDCGRPLSYRAIRRWCPQ